MLTTLAIAALLSSDPTGTPHASNIYDENPTTQSAPRLTPKQKTWFEHAVEDILRQRATTVRRGVDVSFQH